MGFIICCDCLAQPPQTNYRHFDMRHGLAQMKIHCLYEDRLGNIWIGTRNGLSKFNGETFSNYSTANGLIGNRIMEITEDDKGNLIFITEKGISIFDGADFKNIRLDLQEGYYAWMLKNDYSRAIFVRYPSVYTFDFSDYSITSEEIPHPLWVAQDSSRKGYSFIDRPVTINSSTFINSRSETLYEFRDEKDKSICAKYEISNYDSVTINVDGWQNPYYPYYSLTIPSGAAVRLSLSHIVGISQKGYPWSLKGTTPVNDIKESSNGTIFIGSESGIYVLTPQWFYHFNSDKPAYVWSVIEADKGVFVGHSYSHGLYTIDTSFQVDQLIVEGPEEYPFALRSHYGVRSAKDSSGTIYIPHGGLLKMTPKLEPMLDLMLKAKKASNAHFSVHYDGYRDQIIGSMNDRISITKDNEMSYVDMTGIGIDAGQSFESISQDIYNRYWMTSYGGLGVYNPDTEEAIDYGDDYNELVNQGTFGMHQDDSLLWLGLNEGLAKINVHTMQFQKIESVVLQLMVKDIIDYNDSILLIGAKDGLYFFDKKRYLKRGEIDIWPINETYGYTGIEPGFDCFYRDSEDRIWITSASHLSILKPNDDILQRPPLNPNFIRINNESVHFKHSDRTYTIPKGVNDVELVYEACGMMRPKTVQFQYQLDGGAWSAWTADTKLLLDDLPHGGHSVRLRAGPTDLPPKYWPTDQLSFAVNIPFYQRSWVQALFVTLILGTLIYYLIKYYTVRRRQRLYQEKIKENQYLKNQILLSELNPHFIFNALSSIQSNILNDNKLKASNQVVRLSKLMRALLNSSYRGNFAADQENILVPLSEELSLIGYYLAFEQEKRQKSFDYTFHIEEEISIENLFIPPMLIQPLIENSIKHGITPLKNRKGKIDIVVGIVEDQLHITVRDNGIGIAEATRRKQNRLGAEKSLGTKIIAERIEVLKTLGHEIDMEQQSDENGTRVTIIFRHE